MMGSCTIFAFLGEPNNAGGDEDCGHLRKEKSYQWNDRPCTKPSQFVCEKEPGLSLGLKINDFQSICCPEAIRHKMLKYTYQ